MNAEPNIFSDHPKPTEEQLKQGIEVHDERFRSLVGETAEIRHHWKGAEWSEGAVYLPFENVVVWSDIPNNRMLQYDPETGQTTVFREPSNYTNGNTTDREGKMVTATHLTHCISRTELDGSVTVLVDRYQGQRRTSPNAVVVKSDGAIWFTDPPYGIISNREGEKRNSELEGNFVYRFDPDSKELTIVANDLDRPNGLTFSPDESLLYVSDTGAPKNMVVFDVNAD
ncbi:MAG: SMP-30/gluconolactonase/LRE family protein, partial [Opitutales bacterium]|nr:SMP-30/gluconolactonase/LRE family protein [Opitutales bacterium]